jgi:hypothetical protein
MTVMGFRSLYISGGTDDNVVYSNSKAKPKWKYTVHCTCEIRYNMGSEGGIWA